MYRNCVYDSREKIVHLYTWDENGERVKVEKPFYPYLYLEDSKGQFTSIYGTKLRKKIFKNSYERNQFIKESGTRRLFENIPATQQFLIDEFWTTHEDKTFFDNPLRIWFLDIETYSPNGFPDVDNPQDPINIISFYDSLDKKIYSFGLNPYTGNNKKVTYVHCKSEKDLFLKFIEHIEKDYPDVMSGWNCVEKNQHVWLEDRIVPIHKLSNNFENKPLKKYGKHINMFMYTGIKDEYKLKNEHGSYVLSSLDHRFIVNTVEKGKYKNFNTLTKEVEELKVEEIIEKQKTHHVYVKKVLNKNNNKDLTYKEFIKMVPKLSEYVVNQGNDIITYNFTKTKAKKSDFNININDAISVDICALLGFIFTDGTHDGEVFRISNKHQNVTEHYTDIFNKEHNKQLILSTQSITKFNNNTFESFTKQFMLNNKLGILRGLIYDDDNKKKVNVEILSMLSYDQFMSFLSGMIDGDGWIDDTGICICNYDCVKHNFIYDLGELLSWNGMICTIPRDTYIRIPNNNINKRHINNLNIVHKERCDKISRMGFRDIKSTTSKNIRWLPGDGEYLVRLLPVERTGRQVEMCDISTQDHVFLCNGILTHNCDGFDIPYILNRGEAIIGDDIKKISPLETIRKRTFMGQYGREEVKYHIDGISLVDYIEIYKKFTMVKRESYKLDSIGEIELNQNKLDYGDTTLDKLADSDWNTFVDYNIHDVQLLVNLEEKLKYIELLRMLACTGLTTLEGALGTLGVITGALCCQARGNNEVIATFERGWSQGQNPGAYVAEPKRGFSDNVVSFDANSLYPNIMITLNASPETKVGRVTIEENVVNVRTLSGKSYNLQKDKFLQWIKTENYTLSKAGILFTQKKRGILPEFVDRYYNMRVSVRKELHNKKELLEELKRNNGSKEEINKLKVEVSNLHIKQHTIKILINSAYGYTGNKRAALGDDDIASSITLTGQAVIKQSNKIIKNYIKTHIPDCPEELIEDSVVYNDTDSVYTSLKAFENKLFNFKDSDGNITSKVYEVVQDIEDTLNSEIKKWGKAALNSQDCRLVFKREAICDVGLFLQKKRYVLHVLDDEGIKTDKFKYAGVEVVRTTMPNSIKPYAKRVIEIMLKTKSLEETTKALNVVYDEFCKLGPEEIAFVMGINNYEHYANICSDFTIGKKVPHNVKSAYYYNIVIDKLNLTHKYEKLGSGDKVRYLYIDKRNKFGIDRIGFKYSYPKEFEELFTIDYNKIFEKIMFQSIERFYEAVKWTVRKPWEAVMTELSDIFS